MPIRPENKARYPKDWKKISKRIRDRAGNRCEGSPKFPECRAENGKPPSLKQRNSQMGKLINAVDAYESGLAHGMQAACAILVKSSELPRVEKRIQDRRGILQQNSQATLSETEEKSDDR